MSSRRQSAEEAPKSLPGYVDTHCHLDEESFSADLDNVLLRAVETGVRRWINVGYAPERWATSIDLINRFPGMACMLGVHPGHAIDWSPENAARLRDLAARHEVVAIGEVGLDFFRGETNYEQQVDAFTSQLALAHEVGIPAVIHMRDAETRILEVLETVPVRPQLLFHSYDGSASMTDWVLETGSLVGVGGLATRTKSTALQRQIARIPIERIVLETDSPYLVPSGFRHRRNTPESIPHIARFLARLLGAQIGDVARITTANAERFFARLPADPANPRTP